MLTDIADWLVMLKELFLGHTPLTTEEQQAKTMFPVSLAVMQWVGMQS